jgi:hypothetical protein
MKPLIHIGQGDTYVLIKYKSVELLIDSQAMLNTIYDNLEIIAALKPSWNCQAVCVLSSRMGQYPLRNNKRYGGQTLGR